MGFLIGQGKGIENHFLGLSDPFSLYEQAKYVIEPVAFDLTCSYEKGAAKGPQALIEASRNLELFDIEIQSEPYQAGIYTADVFSPETSQKMLEGVYKRTQNHLSERKFVITLGGEHSISSGCIRAHAEQFPHLTVLQFDAHADLYPAYKEDPFSHASVIARVLEIPQVKRVVQVGIRSLGAEERTLLSNTHCFYGHELDREGKWMEKVLPLLEPPLYITFDLDFFDPSLLPATGTPEPGGLFWQETMVFLQKVIAKTSLVGCDVVELSPIPFLHASNFIAAKLVYKLIAYHQALRGH